MAFSSPGDGGSVAAQNLFWIRVPFPKPATIPAPAWFCTGASGTGRPATLSAGSKAARHS
ncbi:hypothetical protein [Dyadobacter chenwenxiniae]